MLRAGVCINCAEKIAAMILESLRQPLADQAGRDVVRAGGRDSAGGQTHARKWARARDASVDRPHK